MKVKGIKIVTKFEDVKDQTTEEYFEGNQFSIDAFKKKYRLTDDETYVQAIWRVCVGIASTEKTPELREYWAARWFDEIYNDWWHPAGSIMQGTGSGLKISVANCTVVAGGNVDPDEQWDSIEALIRSIAYMIARNASGRQGLGFDMGRIRPRGLPVNNSSRISSGAIHWMSFLDSIGSYVGQLGRRPAFLISLPIWHPDVEEFITVKSDWTKIQNANISVQITDAFYEAVRNDAEWTMSFSSPKVSAGDKVYVGKYAATPECEKDENGRYYYIANHTKEAISIEKKVKARDLLRLIAENMFKNAEPGIQNIDIARRMSTSDYLSNENYNSQISATNACCIEGEQTINTDRGILQIKEVHSLIQSGESVNVTSFNTKTNEIEVKPILNSWQQRNDTTITLEVEEDGEIHSLECSSDHKVFTRNRGYVEAQLLTEEDEIVVDDKWGTR
jgi:ribonucleotide reductase alpha subunit